MIEENRLTYLAQIGGGPALGLWQMEPTTGADIRGAPEEFVDNFALVGGVL